MIFTIRDFVKGDGVRFGDNAEKLAATLLGDINRIWDSIFKPEAYKNTKASDLFVFEFQFMPSKINKRTENEFVEKAAELKARFTLNTTNSVFKADAQQDNIPIDGLHIFL